MKFESINPYNGEKIAEYQSLATSELTQKLEDAESAFAKWKKQPIAYRTQLLQKVANSLRNNIKEYAQTISLEMGKPITEAKSELNKCALVCEYYAKHAEAFLAVEKVDTDASLSYIRHDPIGAVFGVMPWNFPFWQVFRFAAPTLTAGNTVLLKHSPNVFGCAQKIEELFLNAGYPKGVFQNLIIHQNQAEKVIAHNAVKAITLTGSGAAGAAVSQLASKYIKKSVLELGGSNAFIVLPDADIDHAVQTAVTARMMNSGQSCIAAKRFIITEPIYDEFVSKFIKKISKLKVGNPILEDTQIGTLARKDLADQLQKQIRDSIKLGAKLLHGGKQKGCFHEPTVMENITTEMPVFKEETFGPLAVLIKVKTTDQAFALADQSKFGLGLSVFTQDTQKVLTYAEHSSDAAFFVNELVKSDPRLPFGGAKFSGYGRELGKDGIMEFINRKTIYVK